MEVFMNSHDRSHKVFDFAGFLMVVWWFLCLFASFMLFSCARAIPDTDDDASVEDESVSAIDDASEGTEEDVHGRDPIEMRPRDAGVSPGLDARSDARELFVDGPYTASLDAISRTVPDLGPLSFEVLVVGPDHPTTTPDIWSGAPRWLRVAVPSGFLSGWCPVASQLNVVVYDFLGREISSPVTHDRTVDIDERWIGLVFADVRCGERSFDPLFSDVGRTAREMGFSIASVTGSALSLEDQLDRARVCPKPIPIGQYGVAIAVEEAFLGRCLSPCFFLILGALRGAFFP